MMAEEIRTCYNSYQAHWAKYLILGHHKKSNNMRSLNEILNDPNTNLIDVREPGEVAEVSINRAVNIPMGDVPDNIDRIKEMKGDIVVFCRSGARSENVKQFLKQNGIEATNAGGYADVQVHLM
jgi:rhodanese-related sulfurtransferase